jgi:hypothetical protein
MRKKYPSVYLDEDGKFCAIEGMDREPTIEEIKTALRWRTYQKLKYPHRNMNDG